MYGLPFPPLRTPSPDSNSTRLLKRRDSSPSSRGEMKKAKIDSDSHSNTSSMNSSNASTNSLKSLKDTALEKLVSLFVKSDGKFDDESFKKDITAWMDHIPDHLHQDISTEREQQLHEKVASLHITPEGSNHIKLNDSAINLPKDKLRGFHSLRRLVDKTNPRARLSAYKILAEKIPQTDPSQARRAHTGIRRQVYKLISDQSVPINRESAASSFEWLALTAPPNRFKEVYRKLTDRVPKIFLNDENKVHGATALLNVAQDNTSDQAINRVFNIADTFDPEGKKGTRSNYDRAHLFTAPFINRDELQPQARNNLLRLAQLRIDQLPESPPYKRYANNLINGDRLEELLPE
jgi:hypothetical protein